MAPTCPLALTTEMARISRTEQLQESKNIKMLKDVGMTVPKSRETSVVYICSNTGNEGLYLYAARQRMKAVYYMHQDKG